MSHNFQDEKEVVLRVALASRAMENPHSLWKCQEVESYSKFLVFMEMPMNLLLWGHESWSLKTNVMQSLSVLLHRSIRRILGFSVLEVREDRIKIEMTRMKF